MKKEVRLYNILFPVWMFILLPTSAWLLILPVNFAVDCLVLWLSMRREGLLAQKRVFWNRIWLVWIFGFLSDLIGAGLLLGIEYLLGALNSSWNTVMLPGVIVFAIPAVLLSGICIYLFDRYLALRKTGWETAQIRRIALALAICTAPYTMLIPLYW